jgi:predicted nucleic acid-binding protein
VTGLVLDCSVAVAWCFDDEAAPATDAVLDRVRDEGACVPAIWRLEIGNVLLCAERRGRIVTADVDAFMLLLGALPIVTDSEVAAERVFTLARLASLTTYDAAYLEIAIRRGLPLATKDGALRAAAARMGVPLIP